MIQNIVQYPLKVTTSTYEVIASGVAHISEPEVTFHLANLVVKYLFKTGSDGARLSAEVVDGALVISLYNFDSSLGQGRLDPIEIGMIADKKLYATFFVNTMEKGLRQFNYTFMLKGT